MSSTVGDLLRIKGSQVETITAGERILDAIRVMNEKHIGLEKYITGPF